MQSAQSIANKFLDIAKEKGKTLSPMKIQKLVYFAHGWCLAIKNQPLFDEDIQAWKFGPVILSLYREFKDCGDDPITHYAKMWTTVDGIFTQIEPKIERNLLNEEEVSFATSLLDKIWAVYGHYSAIQLSNMTHEAGSPWHKVASQFTHGMLPKGLTIPREMIRDYFRHEAANGSRA